MIAESKVLEKKQLERTLQPASARTKTKTLYLICAFAGVFVIAFAACLSHNIFEPNTKTFYFADSRNYLASIANFSTIFIDAMKGKSPAELLSDPSVRGRIEIDGPILASLFGSIFAAMGRTPQADDWKIFVAVNSLMHGLSSLCISFIVYRIYPSLRYAVPAGLAYALFPPALIAAGRLMTETLSNLLIVSSICTLSLSIKRPLWGIVTGFICGVSFINRALLAPPVVASIGLIFFQKKLKLIALALIAVAFVATLTPWALFSTAYLGRTMLTTERCAVLNAVNGFDPETDGIQNTDGGYRDVMVANQSPLTVMYGMIAADPKTSAAILAKKFSRFYGQPFNDFRHRCLGLNSIAIMYVQWMYLFMGILGAALFVFGGWRSLPENSRLLCKFSLLYLVLMQCFFMFEATARPGFTSFPLITVFGVVGVYLLIHTIKNRHFSRAFLIFAGALILTGLVVSSEKLVAGVQAGVQEVHGIQKDEIISLAAGDSARCTFKLSEKLARPFAAKEIALLLIDGDSGLENAKVSVNGKDITTPILPLNSLDSMRFRNYNILRECAYGLGVRVSEIRQWRAAVIPVQYLKPGSENTFEVKAGKSAASIYEDAHPERRRHRDTKMVSVNRLLNLPSGYENRPIDSVLSAKTDKRFELLKAAGTAVETIKPLRMHLAVSQRNSASIGLNETSSADAGISVSLKQDEFPLLMRVANTNEVQVSKYILSHSITGISIKVPPFRRSTHVRVRFSGEFKADSDGRPAGIAITTADSGGLPWLLPNVPFSVPATKEWSRFEVQDVVPVNIYAKPISLLAVGLYPGPWPEASGVGPSVARGTINFRKLKVDVEPYSAIDLGGAGLMVY
ncbi:MAG: hypothetical protein IT342_25335 [Candidatus Melainabacteria bacterium]|jgi:hypothetical protein|nr:hypothetical protein [Candidatus Melainabacteria bacterium]